MHRSTSGNPNHEKKTTLDRTIYGLSYHIELDNNFHYILIYRLINVCGYKYNLVKMKISDNGRQLNIYINFFSTSL